MKMIDEMNIVKINSLKHESITDNVICEYSMTLIVNDVEIATFICSPDSLEYLAVGFLLSENIIKYKDNYLGIIVDKKRNNLCKNIR